MPEPKRPLKVFLCHARDDKLKTRELYRYLRRRGIQPWLDAEDLVGGEDWRVEIPKAIKASDAIIICLSKNSINKEGFVQAEITFALEKALEIPQGRIFIIPVRFEDCEVPNNLERFQWVDLFEEDGFLKLMKSLKTRAGQLERAAVQVPQSDESSPNLISVSIEKMESEASERAERERKEKELRDQQAREAKEKEKDLSEKKEEKPVAFKVTVGGQTVYWFLGVAVLVILITFLSSLNNPLQSPELTPEDTQPSIIFTSTQAETAEPSSTSTNVDEQTPTLDSSLDSTPTSNGKTGFGIIYVSEQGDERSLFSRSSEGDTKELISRGEFSFLDSPTISPNGGQIAIGTNQGIYSVDLSTGLLKQLTTSGIKPVWNPDESFLTFETGNPSKMTYGSNYVCNQDYSKCTPSEIDYLSNQLIKRIYLGNNDEPLPGGIFIAYRGVYSIGWNYDGDKYAYIKRNNVDFICVESAESWQPDCIQTNDFVEKYDWSPVKNEIIFSASLKGKFDLYLLNLDDRTQTNLTNGEYNNYSPIWNHSGNKIAFVSDRDGNNEIYVLDISNLTFENLTNNTSNNFSPLWSPDDSKIIFVSDKSGNLDIYSIEIETREVVNLINDPGNQFFPLLLSTNP